MVRSFILFLLVMTSLYAESKETCYTVQLVSTPYSKTMQQKLLQSNYPKECRVFHIGSSLTVRCGCLETKKEIQPLFEKLKTKYSQPFIRTTYKYRFESKDHPKKEKKLLHKKIDTLIEDVKEKEETAKKSIDKKKTLKQNIQKKKSLHTQASQTKKSHKKQQRHQKQYYDYHDNELRLMYQSFLYSQDLDNAMKVASIGVKRYPNSVYWNQKMAESAQWNTKTPIAMKYMKKVYYLTRDPKLAKKIINYSLEAYQYEEAEPIIKRQFENNRTEKNLKLLLFIYDKIGEPEKSINILEKGYEITKKKEYLVRALRIALEIGDLDRAKRYVTLLENYKPYSYEDGLLIANYYYITKQLKEAYNTLMQVDDTIMPKDEEDQKLYITYHQVKSDMAWYFQDIKTAAHSSMIAIKHNQGRTADFDRTIFYYQKEDPLISMKLAKKAYLKFHLTYFFYTYANSALDHKQYKELYSFYQNFDEKNDQLSNDAMYWMIKSQVYEHFEHTAEAKQYLLKALSLDKDNYQIKLSLIWFLMDLHETAALKEMLLELSNEPSLDPSFYFPIATAYFSLSDMNRAVYYLDLLESMNDPIVKTTQFKFLRAYLFQIQNNPEAFYSIMKDITKTLWKEAKKNPNLKKSSKFWSDYLRAAMYVLYPDKFERRLKKAKPYLKEKDYIDISYSWATMKGANDEAMKIYYSVPKHELWIEFSHANLTQNHSKIENLLDLYLEELSMGDAVQAAYKDGQTALAQTIAYEGMLKNQRNQNVYIKHLELSKDRGDLFDMKAAYLEREPILRNYVRIKNKSYLRNDYFFHVNVAYARQSTTDDEEYENVPENIYDAEMSLQKVYERGYIQGSVGYRKNIEGYGVYKLKMNYVPYRSFTLELDAGLNTQALESTQLMVAGKKDIIAPSMTWNITPSTYIEIYGEYANYNSDDDVNLGDGLYGRATLSYMLKNGYPDMFIYLIADIGRYNEKDGSKGVIDTIQKKDYLVLPEDFYNVGLSFSYGMQNSYLYTRVWRPYFYITSLYNSVTEDYNYDVHVGIGGKVFHQDHLSIGASYSEYFQGINDTVMQIYMNYKFLYFKP